MQKRQIFFILALLVSLVFYGETVHAKNPVSFHDFVVKDIYGDEFYLAELKGSKVMVVNTASRCGLTPQYEELEQLYREYSGYGFVVIGFPANNFMNQEPGTNEEIITFCQENYGVSFPMMSKISVKGNDIAPLYASMLAYFAFFSMNSRRGGTSSPMSIEKVRFASAAFSMSIWRNFLNSGFIVVSHNCSAFISPSPL